jgi:hypothetical protein
MLSVTVAVILTVPEKLVVPLMTPVEAFSVIPFGRLAGGMDQVYGVVPPVAAKPWEYGEPASP